MNNLIKAALLPALARLTGRSEAAPPATGGAYAGVDLAGGQPFAGTQVRLNPSETAVQFVPSVEGNAAGTAGRWQANADVLFPFGARGDAWVPYAGAGLCLVGGTEKEKKQAGLNLVGGLNIDVGPLDAFVQVRLTVADGAHFSLTGGALPASE